MTPEEKKVYMKVYNKLYKERNKDKLALYDSLNKDKKSADDRRYRETSNGDNVRTNNKYYSRYGITLEIYNRIFEEQAGCCAICGKHQIEFKRRLAVDHCHSSGHVRGLLCTRCNLGLGCFNDGTKLLSSAINYLDK